MNILVLVMYLILIYVISLLIAPKIKDKKSLMGLFVIALFFLGFMPYLSVGIIFAMIISYITKIDGLKLSKK